MLYGDILIIPIKNFWPYLYLPGVYTTRRPHVKMVEYFEGIWNSSIQARQSIVTRICLVIQTNKESHESASRFYLFKQVLIGV